MPLQPDAGEAGISNEPSSKCTLCTPPVLFQVTVSPGFTATSFGVNWLEIVALTVWLAPRAGAAAAAAISTPNDTPIRTQRSLIAPTLTGQVLTRKGTMVVGPWPYARGSGPYRVRTQIVHSVSTTVSRGARGRRPSVSVR